MSYCRWSDDNWKSDVYVYETNDGFVVSVAAGRYVGDVPKLPSIDNPEFFEAYAKQNLLIAEMPIKKIGLEYDGQDFCFKTLEALMEKLLDIQKAGYHVPEFCLETIRAELREASRQ